MSEAADVLRKLLAADRESVRLGLLVRYWN
jgi:hypothetical protein